jgi:hypothetical protein
MTDPAQMRCWPEGATEEYVAVRQSSAQPLPDHPGGGHHVP